MKGTIVFVTGKLAAASPAVPGVLFFLPHNLSLLVDVYNFQFGTFIGLIALAMVISQAASTTKKELAEVLKSE